MGRLSVCGVLSLLALLVGSAAVAFAAWFLAGIPAEPGPDGGFLTGFAIVGAVVITVVGTATIGFGLTIAPADADGGGVLTVDSRQRRVSAGGLAALVASLFVPLAVAEVTTLGNAVAVGVALASLGALHTGTALLWTLGETVLVRAGVVN